MPIRRGLFLGRDSCVNQGFGHDCDHSMQRMGKISRSFVRLYSFLFWNSGSNACDYECDDRVCIFVYLFWREGLTRPRADFALLAFLLVF
jgi:hypothetical protein